MKSFEQFNESMIGAQSAFYHITKANLILPPRTMERIVGEVLRERGIHVTDFRGLQDLGRIQGKNNSISITNRVGTNMIFGGLETSGGFICVIEGSRLIKNQRDLGTHILKNRTRAVSRSAFDMMFMNKLDEIWKNVFSKHLPKLKDAMISEEGKEDVDFLITAIKNPDPRNLGEQIRDVYDHTKLKYWGDFEVPEAKKIVGRLKQPIVKDYIDAMESEFSKKEWKSNFRFGFSENGVGLNWNELVVSNIKVLKIYDTSLYFAKVAPNEFEEMKKLRETTAKRIGAPLEILDNGNKINQLTDSIKSGSYDYNKLR
jgi:hypothetical protein